MNDDEPTNIKELARSLEELIPEALLGRSNCLEGRWNLNKYQRWQRWQWKPEEQSGEPCAFRWAATEGVVACKVSLLNRLGTWGSFSAIYYNSHGLNTQQIGIIEGLWTFTPIISSTFRGFVSDWYQYRKLVWVWTKSGGTAILLLLALAWITLSFWRILSVLVGARLFLSSGAILDSYTLEELGTENKMLYGRYRLFASVSWGLGSTVMGWITDNYGSIGTLSCSADWAYWGSFWYRTVYRTQHRLPNESYNETEDESERTNANTDANAGEISDLLFVITKPRVLFFFVESVSNRTNDESGKEIRYFLPLFQNSLINKDSILIISVIHN